MRIWPGFHIQFASLVSLARISIICLILVAANPPAAMSQQAGASGLPLPRFVSLKSDRVNMRVGPGTEFKVEWLYLKKGLPMEIIQEYDNWRRVRDPEGNEGWILHSLLAGKRTAIFKPGESGDSANLSELHSEDSADTAILARVEPGVVGEILDCSDNWCRVRVDDIEGYADKTVIWGVYPDELIEP